MVIFSILIYVIFAWLLVWLACGLIIKLGKRGGPNFSIIPPMPTTPPMPPVKPPREETCYIEKDLGHCSYAWVCEQCGKTTCFDYPLPEDVDWKYCPQCGRKIAEFVPYKEDEDDED